MKSRLLTIMFFLTSFSYGQNISEIFKMLPNECFNNELSENSRIELLKNKKFYPLSNCEEEIIVFSLVKLDSINNFMRIEKTFESGQAAYNIYEIRSFNKSEGSQIVIFSKVSGAHDMFGQNEFQSFEITNNKLVKSKFEYLPIDIGIKDFVKKETPDSLIQKYENYISHSYKLGYFEKKILYELYDFYLYNSDLDTGYLLGNRIEFVWENGKFERKSIEKKK